MSEPQNLPFLPSQPEEGRDTGNTQPQAVTAYEENLRLAEIFQNEIKSLKDCESCVGRSIKTIDSTKEKLALDIIRTKYMTRISKGNIEEARRQIEEAEEEIERQRRQAERLTAKESQLESERKSLRDEHSYWAQELQGTYKIAQKFSSGLKHPVEELKARDAEEDPEVRLFRLRQDPPIQAPRCGRCSKCREEDIAREPYVIKRNNE